MKTVLSLSVLLIVFLFVSSGISSAQPMRMSLEDRVKALKDTLSLTDEQAAKVKEIYSEADAERQKIFEESQGDRTMMRDAMTALMESTNSKIDSLLTPEQKKKFDDYNKARRSRMMQRRPAPPDTGGVKPPPKND